MTDRVTAILAENPNAEIALNLTGFSRGGAEAVAFANLVNERGIPGLYPPGQVPINSMVLFDPVSQTDGLLNVSWPTNLRNPALVMVATAENRNFFPAMPVGADSIIVPIEAVHSNVGGSFNQDGISAVTLKIAHDYLRAAGVPVAEIPPDLQPNWERMYIHNSAIDNYGNVKFSTIGEPTQTVGTRRYYEGAGLGSISVQDALGRDFRVTPIFESRDGKLFLVGYNRKTSSVVTDGETGAKTETADITVYAVDGLTAQGRNFTSTTTDTTGQLTGRLTVTYEANGETIRSTSLTERLPNNHLLTTNRDRLGNTLNTVEQQRFDDGTALQTTTYPGGRTEVIATDTSGRPSSRTDTFPGLGITETVNTYTYDAQGRPVQQDSRTVQRFDDGTRLEEVTTVSGGGTATLRNTYGENGELLSSQAVQALAVSTLTDGQVASVLNDIAGVIGSIQGGKPLPILNSGLRLVNSFTANQPVSELVTTGQIVGGLASLYNLSNAFKNGDALTKVNATLSTLNYVNATLPSLINGTATAPLSAGLNSLLNGSTGQVTNAAGNLVSGQGLAFNAAPGVLPVIGLVLSIKSGDPIGIVSSLIGIINPALLTTPVGWILAGLSVLKALTDKTPEAWGSAKVVFDENGQFKLDSVGEGSGPERVSSQLQGTLDVLNAMLAQAQASSPNNPLGIVPQRMPSIVWREARQDDKGYAITDIDPVTGAQRYPYLRWDDKGTPFSSRPDLWQPDPTEASPSAQSSFGLGNNRKKPRRICGHFYRRYQHRKAIEAGNSDVGGNFKLSPSQI